MDPGVSALRLALATFDNVYDTEPNRRVVSLDRLLDGLSRFELRDDTAAKIRRREAGIRKAYATLQAGGLPSGKDGSQLISTRQEAARQGRDPEAALAQARDRLLYEAHHDAKRLIALWSPACFVDGGRRQSEDVLHLSCLVYDYDAGTALEEAFAHWDGHFAAVHTTWSHTEVRPRFRVILPLARPVRAEDWDRVWTWGAARTEHTVDAAPKGRASTFALPAVASRDAARGSWLRPGELLDPVAMGLAAEAEPAPSVPWTVPHHFDGGRRKKVQLRAGESPAPTSDPVGDDPFDFDAFD